MEELVNLLGLFEEATTLLSGSNYATLSLMDPTISAIKTIFESDNSLTDITEETENNDFSNTDTILDNDENREDEEFLEQPENEEDDVIDPTTRNCVKINNPINMKDIILKI